MTTEKKKFANHAEEIASVLASRERADCTFCKGKGVVGGKLFPCTDCKGSGKQLDRDDFLTLSAQEEG